MLSYLAVHNQLRIETLDHLQRLLEDGMSRTQFRIVMDHIREYVEAGMEVGYGYFSMPNWLHERWLPAEDVPLLIANYKVMNAKRR